MEYIKLNCHIQPDTEINREILVAELGNIGYESFTESDELVEAYIPTSDFSDSALQDLFPIVFSGFQISWTVENIPDQNWNEVWEKNYFQPIIIAERCLIRAPFHTDYPKAEYEIVIKPGMAFGTGNHETTSLMISEILKQDLNGKTVLDMGCGTGILSILASMRGAGKITGIDIDSWATNSTIENATYNKISNLNVIQGGADTIPDAKFDFIYANIQRNILLNDMPLYFNALKRGGELIVSGFYSDDLEPIKVRAAELGLQFRRSTENENWIAAVFTSK
ncbi:MAG TPA: 50S ribosomal protein L11 methyltransferase [Prolixibacteraceae bacterium]|nr:50S ribosomal protein L11 methyltransferase [Prolixibacteraceae bacterium]